MLFVDIYVSTWFTLFVSALTIIIIIIILLLENFSHQLTLMVFYWSLSDSKSLQVSRTLLSILVNLNNIVVWMVSIRPLISKSSSPFNNPSVTVPRVPIIIGINVTFMFHSVFNSQARSWYLSFVSLSFQFYRESKIRNFASSLFCCLL